MTEATTEDYNARMYKTFETLGTKPSEWKWDSQEPKENRGFGGQPAGECQLCGKHPIAYEYTIVNMSRGLRLIVGSECVTNYVEAAPRSDKRKAKEEMQRLMLLNKMTNYIAEQKSLSYEVARKEADEMSRWEIKRIFSDLQRERSAKKMKARAEALGTFIIQNRTKLWNQTWYYVGSQRTILSSLQFLKDSWTRGEERPYMEPAMNFVLVKFGLELPAKPKIRDLEK